MFFRRKYSKRILALTALSGLIFSSAGVHAASDAEVASLQAEIQNKKAAIESITQKLDEYKKKLSDYARQSSSLLNDLALIENDMAMSELDVAATENEIDAAQLELQLLKSQIDDTDERLMKERAMLSDLLFAVHEQDMNGGVFQFLVGAKSFEQVFRAAADLESVNGDLKKTLAATQKSRETLQAKMSEQDQKVQELEGLRSDLERQLAILDSRKNAKEVLITETASSEQEYRELVQELRQEQQSITTRINALQSEVDNRLASDPTLADEDPGSITWPLQGRITTLFHDPTYPFRNLFEHSGLDIAVPQGTAVGAAAPGVVAWARTGKDYGNYVMIIHADGLATLYAHLSKINVTQDQYVSRGDVIGLSGGRPGSPGAGFSTGPHLHFEVRSGGIPVDPKKYLP